MILFMNFVESYGYCFFSVRLVFKNIFYYLILFVFNGLDLK